WNARWMGWSSPSRPSPSTVSILDPSACTASVRQESASRPSSRTVQAPQPPCSQATCTPVTPSSRRRKSLSRSRGSARPVRERPSTETVTARVSATRTCLLDRAADEDCSEAAAVATVGMDVGDRTEGAGRDVRDLGRRRALVQRLFCLDPAPGRAGDAEEHDSGWSEERDRAGESEVTLAARQLGEAERTRVLAWQDDGGQQLVGP